MFHHFLIILMALVPALFTNPESTYLDLQDTQGDLLIKKSNDFNIIGNGSAENWMGTEWVYLPPRNHHEEPLTTKVKILYSNTGIYFLFHSEDNFLTATMDSDFMDLWEEDVVEVFLWPDENTRAYFEYEISPLNYELPILVSNDNGDLVRWQPFHYDAGRKTRRATSVEGGEKKSYAEITAWTAEFFIPYKLLRPLSNYIPQSGTRWRANMYRVDYDSGRSSSWAWQLPHKNFHDLDRFGTFIFE